MVMWRCFSSQKPRSYPPSSILPGLKQCSSLLPGMWEEQGRRGWVLCFHTADVWGSWDWSTSEAKTGNVMIDRVSEQKAAAVLLQKFPCACLGSLSVMTQWGKVLLQITRQQWGARDLCRHLFATCIQPTAQPAHSEKSSLCADTT